MMQQPLTGTIDLADAVPVRAAAYGFRSIVESHVVGAIAVVPAIGSAALAAAIDARRAGNVETLARLDGVRVCTDDVVRAACKPYAPRIIDALLNEVQLEPWAVGDALDDAAQLGDVARVRELLGAASAADVHAALQQAVAANQRAVLDALLPKATPAQLHAALRTAVVTERYALLGVLARHDATPMDADDVRHALRLGRRQAVHVLAQVIERRRAATLFEAARMRDAEQLGALLDDAATAGSAAERQAAFDEATAQRDDLCVRALVERGVVSCTTPLGDDIIGRALWREAFGNVSMQQAVEQSSINDQVALLTLAVRAGGSGGSLAGTMLSYAATRVVAANCVACLEWTGGEYGGTWLHEVAAVGAEATVRGLLDSGAPVDVYDRIGRTPLCMAASIGHIGITRLLLENGADANATGARALPPLHGAACNNACECVQLLLHHGADVDQCTHRDRLTALHDTVTIEVAKLLVDAGADLAALDISGRTPEQFALLGHFDEVANYLRSVVRD